MCFLSACQQHQLGKASSCIEGKYLRLIPCNWRLLCVRLSIITEVPHVSRELDSLLFCFFFFFPSKVSNNLFKMASILLFVVEQKMFHHSLLWSIKHRWRKLYSTHAFYCCPYAGVSTCLVTFFNYNINIAKASHRRWGADVTRWGCFQSARWFCLRSMNLNFLNNKIYIKKEY